MDALDLARWQFGITTVYHFLFVPITIGLGFLVAGFQTAWHRTGDDRWYRLTRFYGKLFLINFAMGVVTGIVQEFQFGMNWSDYSRFVGDIFGAPLAIEGLLAFFLESTFLGLWIFGWDRLPRRLHLATIWAAATGTLLSAYFILAANSFMQNPVGYRLNEATGRAELTDFWAVLTNPVLLVGFPHTVFACFLTAGALVLGVAMWRLIRRPGVDTAAFRSAARLGAAVVLVSGLGVAVSGHVQGQVMTDVQPMKMAAAEGLYETAQPAGFSIFTIGTLDGSDEVFSLRVPRLLSYLATGDPTAAVEGIHDLQEEYAARWGDGDYAPNVPVTYWTFRLMIGTGAVAVAAAAWALWSLRTGRAPTSRWLLRTAIALPVLPLLANSFGWIFTEMGRQPWAVFGLMTTAAGVSPGTTTGEVALTLAGFTLVYGLLAVVEVKLLLKAVAAGLPDDPPPPEPGRPGPEAGDVQELDEDERELAFAY
ncbi:MAG TPA: cytochrome ubiquinol oxidase subunit I [Acidimicrobiales bacterium]|jgi:cytochrome d ubiquinol oxidase subunit I|nr:cytochrome ubiquinol oxidase subunit I [Acidimicrobiales bacterium]